MGNIIIKSNLFEFKPYIRIRTVLSIRNGGGGKKWSPGRVPYIPFYPAVMFHQ